MPAVPEDTRSSSPEPPKARPKRKPRSRLRIAGGFVPPGTHPPNPRHPLHPWQPGELDEREVRHALGRLALALAEADGDDNN